MIYGEFLKVCKRAIPAYLVFRHSPNDVSLLFRLNHTISLEEPVMPSEVRPKLSDDFEVRPKLSENLLVTRRDDKALAAS